MPAAAPEDRPLRVALITTSFPLGEGSMSGIFVHRLADALADRVDLRVVVPAGTEATGDEQQPAGAPRFTLQPFRYAPRRWQRLTHRPGGLPAALARRDPALALLPTLLATLYRACRRAARSSHLVHANWSLVGAVAALAARGTGVPVVTTLRGSDVTRAEGSPLDRWLLRRAVAGSAALTSVSPDLLRRARHLLPPAAIPMVAIPNGIDDACFAAGRGRRAEVDDHPLLLLGVGNLVAHKDVDTVIRALSHLPADLDWRLRWLGSGPRRGELEELASAAGIADRVELAGRVAPTEVPAHLGAADVFVFSSRGEGRPNALLEAMAAALPAVVPRVPGVTELVRDGHDALLYDSGDAAGLAQRLERLCRRPELRRSLGAAARRGLLAQDLTWAAAARRYEVLYHQVVMPAADA